MSFVFASRNLAKVVIGNKSIECLRTMSARVSETMVVAAVAETTIVDETDVILDADASHLFDVESSSSPVSILFKEFP
jgi:hypothetical protein